MPQLFRIVNARRGNGRFVDCSRRAVGEILQDHNTSKTHASLLEQVGEGTEGVLHPYKNILLMNYTLLRYYFILT